MFIGIIPDEYRQKAADILADAVIGAGTRIQTGNITTPMLFDMLSQYGYTDLAWELLTKEDYPSWGYMLANGATTIWERFELKKDGGMNSHNHPMYGAVSGWLQRSLAGFKTLVPNKSYTLCPKVPQKLLYFEVRIPQLCGDIYMKYEKKYNNISYFVDVPCGTELKLILDDKEYILTAGFHAVTN